MEELADAIAIKEHLARKVGVHPRDVEVDGEEARCRKVPLSAFPFGIDRQGGVVSVSDDGPERLDLGLVQDYWRGRLGIADSPREQLLLAAVRRFLGRLTVIDPAALEKILDFGFWRRAEREDYRCRAAALGLPTVIHFLDVPEAVLVATAGSSKPTAGRAPCTKSRRHAQGDGWENSSHRMPASSAWPINRNGDRFSGLRFRPHLRPSFMV